MRRSLGRCLRTSRYPFLASLALPTAAAAATWRTMGAVRLATGKAATYAPPGTAVAFIISELPGERAEALFIAKAALVPTAGEQFTNRPGLRLRARSAREKRRLNRRTL